MSDHTKMIPTIVSGWLVVSGSAILLTELGWPPNLRAVYFALLIATALPLRKMDLRCRRRDFHTIFAERRRPSATPAILLMTSFSSVLITRIGAGTFFPVIPNHDALHHLARIRNITNLNSLRDSAIYSNIDGQIAGLQQSFYPHAGHLLLAPFVDLADTPSVGLSAGVLFFFSIVYPTGLYAMMRSFGLTPLHSAAATAFGCSIGLIPYGPLSWGGLPILLSLCTLPHGIATINNTIAGADLGERLSIFTLGRLLFLTLAAITLHPTLGALLLGYLAISTAIRPAIMLVARLAFIALGVGVFTLPIFQFMPGSGVFRALGNIDPFYGDSAQQLGQIITFSPNSPLRYAHMFLLLCLGSGLLIIATYRREVVQRHVPSVPMTPSAVLLCVMIGLLNYIVVFGLNSSTWEWTSWLASLWYRQYARTAYLMVLVVLILFGLALAYSSSILARNSSPEMLPSVSNRTDSKWIKGGVVLVSMIAILTGVWTSISHSEQVWSIGPITSRDSSGVRSVVTGLLDSDVFSDDDLYLVSTFQAGGSVFSADLGIPSSGEPYGRTDVASGLAALLSAGATREELSTFLRQYGSALVLTNSRDQSEILPNSLVADSGMFEKVFQGENINLWELAEVQVEFDNLGPTRSDLYGGLQLRPLFSGELSVLIQNSSWESSYSVYFEVRSPPCDPGALLAIRPVVSRETLDIQQVDNTVFGVSLIVEAREELAVSLQIQGSGCVVDGDLDVMFGLVSDPRVSSVVG